MSNALNSYSYNRQTNKTNPRQVKNNAGGYVYEVSGEERLRRFIIIGTTGGTYYQSEQDITESEADFVTEYVRKDWESAFSVLKDSHTKAKKKQFALFVLACLYQNNPLDDYHRLEEIALNDKLFGTPTDVFTFMSFLKSMGTVGRAKTRVVKRWYEEQPTDTLLLRSLKYRQRGGWSHVDAVRLSHPVLNEDVWQTMVDPAEAKNAKALEYAKLKSMTNSDEVMNYIRNNNDSRIPWEFLPTEVLSDPIVWATLYRHNQLTGIALIRNMWRLVELKSISTNKLIEDINKTKVHPLMYLLAANAIISKHIDVFVFWSRPKNLEAVPSRPREIAKALAEKFNEEIKGNAILPEGHKVLAAFDVSGSMHYPVSDKGKNNLSCMGYGMALARAFASSGHRVYQFSDTFRELPLGEDWIEDTFNKYAFGRTDCAQPMLYAIENRLDVDTFIVYTDSETWAGRVKPDDALREYRRVMNKPNAKLIVIAATGTRFTIADPEDGGMFDVCGTGSDLFDVVAQLATI